MLYCHENNRLFMEIAKHCCSFLKEQDSRGDLETPYLMSLLIWTSQGCYGLHPKDLGIHLSGSWPSLSAISLMRFTHLDRNRRPSVEENPVYAWTLAIVVPGYKEKKQNRSKESVSGESVIWFPLWKGQSKNILHRHVLQA